MGGVATAELDPRARAATGNITIVVADDNDDIRRLIRLQLRRDGCTIIECADGRSALEACRRVDVDLALLDIDMPHLDGFEVLRSVRADPALNELPVILLTAHALPGGVVKGLDLGAHDYLRKPFDVGELRARVSAAVKLRRRTVELVEARQRFSDFLEHTDAVAFLKDLDGRYLYVNRRWAEVNGAPVEHAIGTTAKDHLPPPLAGTHEAIDVAVAAGRRSVTEDVLHDRTYLTVKFPVRGADGAVYGVGGMLTDITARKEAEAELRTLHEHHRALLEHSSDITTVLDGTGRVRFMSPSGQRLLAARPARVDAPMIDLAHPDDRAALETALQAAGHRRASEPLSVEWRAASREGEWIHLETVITNLFDQPSVGGLVLNSRNVTERVEAAAQLSWRAFHDELTGLPNRALLDDRLQQALHRAQRGEADIALLFLDLDRFKVVNDSLGHAAGDRVLIETARRLQRAVRPSDTVARMGGDEFIVLLEGINRPEDVTTIVDRIRDAVGAPVDVGGQVLITSVSIGVAMADGHTADALLRDADTALYRAKDRGRDRYELFDEGLRSHAVRRLETERLLRVALDTDGFRVHYQPIFDLHDGSIAVEALVRMATPDGGLIEPGEFIGVAEESGLIIPLGVLVLHEACRQAARWSDQFGERAPRRVAVNVSPRQLGHPRFVDDVASALAGAGLDASRLCLELTEGSLIEASPSTRATIERLQKLGVRFAIDDFGTGYASLSYLKRFPVDYVKIDRSFVAGLGSESDDSAIVRAIINLSATLGLTAIAEGVETAEQLARLESFGCTQVQGFHLARPQSSDQLTPRLVAELGQPDSDQGSPLRQGGEHAIGVVATDGEQAP